MTRANGVADIPDYASLRIMSERHVRQQGCRSAPSKGVDDMKTIALIAGGVLLLAADGTMAQPQAASPPTQTNAQVSCPMASSGAGAGMMGAGMMGPGGMANMQQMQTMHTQMHDEMQAMHTQMTAMHDEMQAMHQEMMKMRRAMPKHHH